MQEQVDVLHEAIRIAELAQERGIVLRLMGACAVRVHCPRFAYLHDVMKRAISDVDFASYGKFRANLDSLFSELGCPTQSSMALSWSRDREIFHLRDMKIDIFFDKLQMCHVIDFRGRLELDFPTIPLADVVLEKMQIVRLTEKDMIDTILLLREHEVAEGREEETVNAKYIARLLSSDWGFYHTVTMNLHKLEKALAQYDALSQEDRESVSVRIAKLLETVEAEPKTYGWKARAKIGERKKWYDEVEDWRGARSNGDN